MNEISPSLTWLLAATIVIYVIVMYALSWWVQGQVHDAADFVVAGRRLPLSLAWATLLATWFGAETILTVTDNVRSGGVPEAGLDPLGVGLCLILAGFFYARRLWEMKLLTVCDFFRLKFGRASEVTSALIMVPSYFGWIAAQFIGLAGLLNYFFDIPLAVGIALVAAVGMGYTLMGGMWSVTLTDAVQISLVLVGLVILGGNVLWHVGNQSIASGLMRLATETPPELLRPAPTHDISELVAWLSAVTIGALGNIPGQDLMQRVFSSKSASVARNACWCAGAAYIVFGAVPVLMGLSARLLFPGEVSQDIVATLAHNFLHPVLAVIFLLVVMSAVLSTIDSAILSPATVLAENVLGPWLRDKMSNLALCRWCVVLVTAGSLAAAYQGVLQEPPSGDSPATVQGESDSETADGEHAVAADETDSRGHAVMAYELLEGAYALTLVGLFVPLTLGIYIRPRGQWPAMAAMVTGSALWLWQYCGELAGLKYTPEHWLTFGEITIPMALFAPVIALLTYLAVHFSRPLPAKP